MMAWANPKILRSGGLGKKTGEFDYRLSELKVTIAYIRAGDESCRHSITGPDKALLEK